MRAISASASRFSVAARTPIRTGPRSDGPPDLRFSNRAFSFSTEFASKLYRGASALATGSMCISHPTRGTPAAGQCGSRSRAALGQHGDEIGPVNAECRVPARQSVTWTGAIGVPSWRKYRESGPTLAPHFSTDEPSPTRCSWRTLIRGQEPPGADFAKS